MSQSLKITSIYSTFLMPSSAPPPKVFCSVTHVILNQNFLKSFVHASESENIQEKTLILLDSLKSLLSLYFLLTTFQLVLIYKRDPKPKTRQFTLCFLLAFLVGI